MVQPSGGAGGTAAGGLFPEPESLKRGLTTREIHMNIHIGEIVFFHAPFP